MACNVVFAVTILVITLFPTTNGSACEGKCVQSEMNHHELGTKDRGVRGHTFKTYVVSKVFDCHEGCFQERCRCKAFQIFQRQCELLDEDRFSAPEDFVPMPGSTYFDMKLEYVTKQSTSSACPAASCRNGCCAMNPCLNGGTCAELCDDVRTTFNCSCATGFIGKLCQTLAGTSCKEHRQYLASVGHNIKSGVFPVLDSQNMLHSVFCDFGLEDGFTWTVIESFTRGNKAEFTDKPFYKNYEVNQDVFTWSKYRLSLSRMNKIAENSTHFRATCRFDEEGLNYTDYLRAKLTETDILSLSFDGCREYEYINVRGYSCHNCTAQFAQRDSWHAHFDSYWGSLVLGCQFNASVGAVRYPGGEDDFGCYQTINPAHRCMTTDTSTTQWWLGGK